MTTSEQPPEEAATPSQVQRSIELLWRTRERPTRGPRPRLTLNQIVAAAIMVADTEGLEGLSMRRVASKLGVGTMSLYRYVPGKAELLDLMLDQVSGVSDGHVQASRQGWRAVMEHYARAGRELYLAHPWLARANWTRPVFGPNTLASFELVVGALAGLDLSDRERIHVITMVDNHVTGAVRQEILYAAAPEETGISNEEFWSLQHPVLEWAMGTGDYPSVAELAADTFDASWEDTFEFGLQRLLDGLEILLESRARPTDR